MPVSASPWWWSPETIPGATIALPIQSLRDPCRFPEIASYLRMPGVCAVSSLSSLLPVWCSCRCQAALPASDPGGW